MRQVNIALIFLALSAFAGSATAETNLERKIDSLFVIASSGEVRYRDLNEPAMDSIAALGEAAVPHLIDKFTTKSARERWTVIWTLQRIGEPAIPYLVDALDRPDGLVVQRVCWALGDVGDSTAVEPLIGVRSHPRWQVREQATEALGKIGHKRADDAVLAALVDNIGQVRKAAVVACGRLEIHESIPRLVHRMGDDFYGARMMTLDALKKLDTGMVMETLMDSVHSANPFTGDLCCRLLGDYGTDRAREKLAAVATATADENDRLRVHAAVALVRSDPLDNCGFHERVLASITDRLDHLKVESALLAARNDQKEPAQ